ncbi:MAG: FAD-binding oxidoreductase [Armatimonadetes bacterium]|nr:FAD-binding oxidoreductase [Armatimonadota bacterium]
MSLSIDSSAQVGQDDRAVRLRAAVGCTVLTPGDPDFETVKAPWNLSVEQTPDFVVLARSEDDVRAVVAFCRDERLPIGVQTTGHGQPRGVSHGVLLDLKALNAVEIDQKGATATVGGGALWSDVIGKAVPLGLVPVSGSSPGVGVVGYTLGGGYGLLSRRYGLASDSVASFRIVTSDGDVRSASPESEPDLFWSVLGGGGGFGVITEMTFRLYPHPPLFAGSVMFDAALAPSVYAAYLEWTGQVPEEVGSAILMIRFPPVPFVPEPLQGRAMVVVAGSALADAGQAEALWAPIRSLPGAEFDSFRPMSYDQSHEIFREPVDPLPAVSSGVLLADLDDDALTTLLSATGPMSESPNMVVQIRHLGGAMGRTGPSLNATGDRRRAKFLLHFLGVPMGPVVPDAMEEQSERVFAALSTYVVCRGPLNWIGEGRVRRERIEGVFHTDEAERLSQTKASVDPSNLFRYAGFGIED